MEARALAKAVLFPSPWVCTSLKSAVTSGTNARWKRGAVLLLRSHERGSIWYHIGLRAQGSALVLHLRAPLAHRPEERAFPPEGRGGPTWSPGGAAAPAIALGGLRGLSRPPPGPSAWRAGDAPRPRRGQCGARAGRGGGRCRSGHYAVADGGGRPDGGGLMFCSFKKKRKKLIFLFEMLAINVL